MATGERLTGPEKVRQLQTVLHAKAKEEPERRFHALIDKVWREDCLAGAYRRVRRNGGAAGVDGEDFTDIESYGVERWLGELARELREGTYTPKPVRQVLIPKKQPGKFRPLGIPCIRDWVAQTSALLVLEPIFEADLFLGYRIGRNYRRTGAGSYIGTRPSKASVQSICRKIGDRTAKRHSGQPSEVMVARLNRIVIGWANYFSLGEVSPAYRAVNRHTVKRLRRWLCDKHKTTTGHYVRFPDPRLYEEYGLFRLTRQNMGLPSATA